MKGYPNLFPIVIAFIVGVVLGYGFKSSSLMSERTSQEKKEEKTMVKKGSKEWKIKNAMSAAPRKISKNAAVLDWPAKEGEQLAELRKGTNDWTCLPDFPGSPGNDPICVDKQAMLWFQAYMSKEAPSLTQTGLAYMLQGGSDPSNTDPYAEKPAPGEDWLSAPAHIMVFPAGDLDPAVYGTDHKSGNPWIMWSGTPHEHLMVPVK